MATALCPYMSGFLEEIIEFTKTQRQMIKGFVALGNDKRQAIGSFNFKKQRS